MRSVRWRPEPDSYLQPDDQAAPTIALRITERWAYFLLWRARHKRKNFLFADTPAGASASALIYSVIESAKANGQNVLEYLTVVLAQLPGATTLEEIEALLPWAMSREEVARLYAEQPTPAMVQKNLDAAM